MAPPAPLELAYNVSNLNSLQSRLVVTGGTDSEWVKQLGPTDSLGACGAACASWGGAGLDAAGAALRCRSFTRFGSDYAANASLAGLCFGHVDGAWLPLPVEGGGIDAGTVTWPCATDLDCSLNGKCPPGGGTCACGVGWVGRRCETLNLAPVDRARLGFDPTSASASGASGASGASASSLRVVNMSSWGASVQQINGTWHMWASVMANKCGISAYLLNSGVVHATSSPLQGPLGPYSMAAAAAAAADADAGTGTGQWVLVPFAHEPVVAVAPSGELVMASVTGPVGGTPGATHSSCECATGATAPNCTCRGDNSCVTQTPTLSVAARGAAAGPWRSAPMWPASMGDVRGENPSIWIDRNGSLWGASRGGRTSAFAADWKDKATYVRGGPGGAPSSLSGSPDVEDPFIYQDEDDHFHQLIHSLEGPHMCLGVAGADGLGCLVGVHAYSLDGTEWLFGGVAYRSVVNTTDGGQLRLNRRERPHLVFAEGTRRPVALSTSAEAGGAWGDRTFTLVQGIVQ